MSSPSPSTELRPPRPELLTIVYASRATAPLDATALTEMLGAARARNAEAGVTGMLIYAYESFLEQLEGEPAAVEAIFASIQRDPRHRDIRVFSRRPVDARRYAGWSMGFEHPGAETLSARLPGYRAAHRQPLVNSTLISDTEMAETVLDLAARADERSPG